MQPIRPFAFFNFIIQQNIPQLVSFCYAKTLSVIINYLLIRDLFFRPMKLFFGSPTRFFYQPARILK